MVKFEMMIETIHIIFVKNRDYTRDEKKLFPTPTLYIRENPSNRLPPTLLALFVQEILPSAVL
jgi:hypothetical protein